VTSKDAALTGTLLVSCPDRPGLVAALAQVLHGHGANLLDSEQHTDAATEIFSQRVHFETTGMHVDRATLENAIHEVADRLNMTWQVQWSDHVKRVAIFTSKQDHCLYDLLLRHRANELACEIPCVVSNHPDAEPIARHFGITFHAFPITPDTKLAQEEKELALLREEKIELVVMARYMQILSPEFLRACPAPVINIHHSFLPALMGGKPYHQAHARGVKLIGATAHYATEELDEGPIIEQDVIRTSHRDDVRDLVRKGRDVERVVLSRAVRWHLEDRVIAHGNKTVVLG